MASIKQEQALGAVAPAVPEEQQSTAADDVVAPGSTQAPLVGKPLGQLPGDRVGIDIISPTPTVGNGASCSQPVPTPAVPGHVGTYIGLPGYMAFGGPVPGVPVSGLMAGANQPPGMWTPPVFAHGMDMAASLMAMTDGYAGMLPATDDLRVSSGLSVESLDSSASLALYWPVHPSTFALTSEDVAALQADPATLQAYQTAMLDAGVPYSGYPLGVSDNDMSMSGALASGGNGGGSPTLRTPTAADKRRGPRSSTSKFRGVSCYKRTGRWESHIWSNGKQVHLGSFRLPEEAARAYDMAAICFRGWDCETNFPPVLYRDDCVLAWHMQNDTTEQYVAWLRRGGKEPNSLGVLPPAVEGQGLLGAPAETANDASLPATDTTALVTHSATDEALQAAPDATAAAAAAADTDFVSFAREVVLSG